MAYLSDFRTPRYCLHVKERRFNRARHVMILEEDKKVNAVKRNAN